MKLAFRLHAVHHGSVTLQCIVVALSKLPPEILKELSRFGSPAAQAGATHPPLPCSNTASSPVTWANIKKHVHMLFLYYIRIAHVGFSCKTLTILGLFSVQSAQLQCL